MNPYVFEKEMELRQAELRRRDLERSRWLADLRIAELTTAEEIGWMQKLLRNLMRRKVRSALTISGSSGPPSRPGSSL